MPIGDKTRKILWGRSGNRCAMCRHELVADATATDDESIIGDECHIVSPSPNGPRHDGSHPQEKLDAYDNLILLCRIHHKLVDDQESSYTAGILRQTKADHETWVSEKLTDKPPAPKRIVICQVEQSIPGFQTHPTTGEQILNLVQGAGGNPRPESVEDKAVRIKREIAFVNQRSDFLNSKESFQAADEEVSKLFKEVSRICEDIRDPSAGIAPRVSVDGKACNVSSHDIVLRICWERGYSLTSSTLRVMFYDDHDDRLPFDKLNPLQEMKLTFDIERSGTTGWLDITAENAFYVTTDLARRCVDVFLDSISNQVLHNEEYRCRPHWD